MQSPKQERRLFLFHGNSGGRESRAVAVVLPSPSIWFLFLGLRTLLQFSLTPSLEERKGPEEGMYIFLKAWSRIEFLNLDTVDIWDQIILCWGQGAVSCIVGYLAASPGLYPLDASSTPKF